MNQVAIVILNWNGVDHLAQFLPSVIENSLNYVIYLVDNGSTDNSLQYIEQNFPEVKIIAHKQNYGFADGYNLALEQIDAKYFVLLNSDVEVSKDWVEPIIQLMDQDTNVAACQPKILDFKQNNHFEYAGAAGGFIDYLGYPFCRGRIFNTIEKDIGQYDDTCEIFWASGAAFFIRADIFKEVGGLDGIFFAHMEEIDLCWRIKNLGYKVLYCGASKVYHVGGGTLNKINPTKTYLNFRNNLYLLYKNLPSSKKFAIIFLRLVLDGLAGIKLLSEFKPKHTWAIVKAHFHFYNLVWKHRPKSVTNVNRNEVGILPKSILLLNFFRGKKTYTDIVNP